MALNQSWMLVVGLVVVFAVVGVVWLIGGRKKGVNTRVVGAQFSNLARLTSTETYGLLYRKYVNSLFVIVGCVIVGLIGMIVVSAKPVTVNMFTPTKYSRDIVLCLDVSGSMEQVDVEVIDKFKRMLPDFEGERLALVIWNSTSNLVFPLTDDYEYIDEQLSYVSDGFKYDPITREPVGYDFARYVVGGGGGGSLVGDGLTGCTLAFDKDDSSEKRSKSIILATDNIVNGEQIISLDEAAQYAKDEGVKVYGIRPTTGFEVGGEADSMKEAIELTGGLFYPLNDSFAVDGIVTKIGEEEAGAIKGDTLVMKHDNPFWWILGSIVLLWVSFGLMWRFKV